FKAEYIDKAYELLKLTVETSKKVIQLASTKMSIAKSQELHILLEEHLDKYRTLAEYLNKKINSGEHLIDRKQNNQIDDWHHREYIIPSINKLQKHLFSPKKEDEIQQDGFYDLIDILFQKDIHILSSAGYGKTNIACNICTESLRDNIPAILILGSSFRKNE